MIVLHVTYQAHSSDAAQAFYQELSRENVLANTRAEPGCVHYQMFSPKEEPSQIFLLEVWTDAVAQQFHKTTTSFDILQEKKAKYILHTQLQQYITQD